MIYNDEDYAMNRLNTSVILVEEMPTYLKNLGDGKLLVYDLLTKEEAIVDLQNLKYDITPVKLGFINLSSGCLHVSRSPRRQWKQGLTDSSLVVNPLPEKSHFSILISRALGLCILNRYPTLVEAYNQSKGRKGVAFSRNFYLTGKDLFNRKGLIGSLNDNGEIYLNSRFKYLKEQIEGIIK